MAVLKTRVVGQAHRDGAQTRLNGKRHGDELRLVREPKNPYDRAAIAVYDGDFKLGYIPKVDNRNLAIAIDQGMHAAAFIDEHEPKLHVIWPVKKE